MNDLKLSKIRSCIVPGLVTFLRMKMFRPQICHTISRTRPRQVTALQSSTRRLSALVGTVGLAACHCIPCTRSVPPWGPLLEWEVVSKARSLSRLFAWMRQRDLAWGSSRHTRALALTEQQAATVPFAYERFDDVRTSYNSNSSISVVQVGVLNYSSISVNSGHGGTHGRGASGGNRGGGGSNNVDCQDCVDCTGCVDCVR